MVKLLKYCLILAKVFLVKLFLSCYSLLIHSNKAYIYIHHTFHYFHVTTLDVLPGQHNTGIALTYYPTLMSHLARVCVHLLLY